MKRRSIYSLNKSAIRLLAWAILACSIISHPVPAASPDAAQKKVLIISFQRKGAPLQNLIDYVLKRALSDGLAGRIDFYDEFIDTNRFPNSTYYSVFGDFLRRKYEGKRFDLIITSGGAAIDLVEKYSEEIFPGAPVVFLGDGKSPPEQLRAKINCAGIKTSLDYKKTIDLALQLQARVNQVFVVSGESEFDKYYLNLFRQQIREIEGRLTFSYLNGISLEEIQKKVANLPQGSIVFFLNFGQDLVGNYHIPKEILHQIATAANAPIYVWLGSHMSREVVGGSLLDIEAIAIEGAGMALRVLRGEDPKNIPIKEYPSDSIVLSRPQLERWGISENKLPRGSRILYREPTFWQQYKYYVIAALSIIAAQSLFIGLLVFERQRRRILEERFSEAFRASPDVIIIIRQADRRIIDINDSCEKLFGVSRGEIIGRTPAELRPYVNEVEGQRVRNLIDEMGSLHNVEVALRTRSGEARQTSISSETIVINGEPCFISIIHDITELKKAEDALRELTGRLLKLQDEERRRIARELHDVTASNLFTVNASLSRLIHGRCRPSESDKILLDCHTSVQESLKEIRTFSYLLHPPMLEEAGLRDTLQWYFDGFLKRSGIFVDLHVSEDIDRLEPDIEIAFFRIVQESLTNVHRHSGSSTASIKLEKQAGQLVLRIKDNGHGLPPKDSAQETTNGFLPGVGISGMRERMRQLGGTLEIESSSEGTIVTARAPLIEAREARYDSRSVGR